MNRGGQLKVRDFGELADTTVASVTSRDALYNIAALTSVGSSNEIDSAACHFGVHKLTVAQTQGLEKGEVQVQSDCECTTGKDGQSRGLLRRQLQKSQNWSGVRYDEKIDRNRVDSKE